ncbi:hypothetical protein CLPU_8c00740 [Gottschalkia purinilytica]|uniref:DUF4004 domain-containing protein n=1 Tax=Gottschalkia purinilytica TaxID=1503 RepID=A0A0L0W9V2_GOTPU|nr:DUF4004 family protein [Gottschalkia purinilytica]KNF08309.1 hypothetical protein CLPU_8c00740 [Gottschalkia purinilytica]
MNEELISKKELLKSTGISYGQLYRWKRKKLIPEEWFIKKSSYTGQETYFPKESILQRIETIMNLKDDISLDELAEMLSNKGLKRKIMREELLERGIVSEKILESYETMFRHQESYDFDRVVIISLFNDILNSNKISISETKGMINLINNTFDNITNDTRIIFIKSLGIGGWILTKDSEIIIDNSFEKVFDINISQFISNLKLKFD